MDREDNKEIRKENGRLVCDTMREIGGPANFKTIKANLMEKVSGSLEPQQVSGVMRSVLRKGVNNGYLYKDGLKYSTVPLEQPSSRDQSADSTDSGAEKPVTKKARGRSNTRAATSGVRKKKSPPARLQSSSRSPSSSPSPPRKNMTSARKSSAARKKSPVARKKSGGRKKSPARKAPAKSGGHKTK